MTISSSIECPIACDCKAWLEAGVNKSGIYPIKPDGDSAFQVEYKQFVQIIISLY